MSSAASRAGALCGALVGACSGLLTAAAHAAAGGGMPGGAAAALLLLICSAVGAATSAAVPDGRRRRPALLAGALVAGQLLGHVALAGTGHHGTAGVLPSAQMMAAHGAAALVLSVLIAAFAHLYVVCASVLSWLFLVSAPQVRPIMRRWTTFHPLLQSRLLPGGTRMRAPPAGCVLTG